ncbi:thiamine ABC transporter ATP-binding protein [Nitratireductor mangrovi]|uniref:Thiamine ABC transporter ATP-binding protein n=1 Tax=Nitratireductor mangrovi TaxID=2599600 RepID=A0A5B8KY70_9HYPH|nr:thiamine ABC transporter ATP-binding protein [Nitratireductor mangrovi]QDZ00418.1 thiamine ABC transporter ATP-binding protein [Nitratireductor mangrovi]
MSATGQGQAIRIENVAFSYGGPTMQFDLDVPASTLMALMGPSGSGKSTLLSLIAGFETPLQGEIRIGDIDITPLQPAARPVSMVFQENNLFAHLDVAANVGLGRSPSLRLGAADREAIAMALAKVGLAGKEKRLPRELSGGERQRVALARALVRDKPVLLLDEPFASLGPALRRDMLELVARLHAETGMTVVMVTHDPDDARTVAPLLAFLDEGRVLEFGKTSHILSEYGPDSVRRYLGDTT